MRLVHWPLHFCLALDPFVFVPQNFVHWPEDLKRSVLAHEHVHHRQQRAVGHLPFYLLYAFDVNFRWRIERRGYEREMWELARQGLKLSPERYARSVSSSLYWGMVDYETALKWAKPVAEKLNGARHPEEVV
jgi:hypothetical protein